MLTGFYLYLDKHMVRRSEAEPTHTKAAVKLGPGLVSMRPLMRIMEAGLAYIQDLMESSHREFDHLNPTQIWSLLRQIIIG